MMKSKITIRLRVLLLAMSLPALGYFQQTDMHTEGLALVGAKIYPAPFEEPVANGVILIKDGKITAAGPGETMDLPSNARVINCEGLVIMAGFWNTHVHFMEAKWQEADRLPAEQLSEQMKAMLSRYGFTHAFDLATLDLPNLLVIRGRIESGEVQGPAILTAGVPFTPAGGSPFYIAPLKLPELSTPEQARDYVNGQVKAGADAIKLWSASPNGQRIVPMPADMLQAATATAHALGMPVFAHPTNLNGVKIAVAGGVDILAHVAADDYTDWDAQTISTMLASQMALIPTLKLHQWELERMGLTSENHPLLKTAVSQLQSYRQAGGEILFGTDVGYMSDYDPEDEYVLMAEAGMDYSQILATLTTVPARRFGLQNQTGRIALGMDADLVILSADPAEDIRNFSKVQYTIRRGRIIYP